MILKPQWRPRPMVIMASFAIFTSAALAFGYFGSTSYGFVLDTEVPGMSRADFWRNGVAMIAAYMPFGSGLGTFEQAYPLFEDPDLVDSTYVNHAHNDFLELTIEGGLFALGLIAAFLAWLAKRCLGLIGRPEDPEAYALLLVIGVLTLHSLVDYPLRTAALSLVFAMALGLLTRPRTPESEGTRRRR
jgi:O-antigen ligase